MKILDTNVLSEMMKPTPNGHVIQWIDNQHTHQLYISSITRAEIELGIALLPSGKRKEYLRFASQKMFAEFSDKCLPFDEKAAIQYGSLVANRTKLGKPISVEDGQIAAIALAHNATLITRNVSDFQEINNLNSFNPWPK